ncbi:MAG: alpha/beta fold hydrolase, partial [Deltaproteobacteria bacterium]
GFAWRYLAPRLAKNHCVVHWHFRGHGRSGPPLDRDRMSIEDLTSDLRTICDHLEIERPVIAAHSMGVQVALEYCRQNPNDVAALALMCGTFGRITTTFHGTDLLDQILPSLIRGTTCFRAWPAPSGDASPRRSRFASHVPVGSSTPSAFKRKTSNAIGSTPP